MGTKRKHKYQTKGIWEEGSKKNLWTLKEKDGTWWIKSNEELNRLTGNKNHKLY